MQATNVAQEVEDCVHLSSIGAAELVKSDVDRDNARVVVLGRVREESHVLNLGELDLGGVLDLPYVVVELGVLVLNVQVCFLVQSWLNLVSQ